MIDRRGFLWDAAAAAVAAVCRGAPDAVAGAFEVTRSDAEWRALLTPDAVRGAAPEGTERPYTSPLNDEHRRGTFACAGCGLALFASETKFESGTGWPSFWAPLDERGRHRARRLLRHGPHRGASASAAAATSGTSSRTGRRPPAFATA